MSDLTRGRSIRIYLVEGTVNSLMTAEIMNWTGKVIVAPRTELANLEQRDDIQRAGVYMLVGEDPQNPFKEKLYIGESDNVIVRLFQHNKSSSKDFWNRTVIITSKDQNLTKAHVRYLESRLINISDISQRSTKANGTNPPLPHLPESDKSDMEFFLAQLQILLPVLGFNFLTTVPTYLSPQNSSVAIPTDSIGIDNSPLFTLNYAGIKAEAQEIGNAFIVFKDSQARKVETPTLGKTDKLRREQYRNDGKVIESNDGTTFIFTQNVDFNSPSAAAKFITGSSVNGREIWKVKDSDETYNQWDQAKLNQVIIMPTTDSDEDIDDMDT